MKCFFYYTPILLLCTIWLCTGCSTDRALKTLSIDQVQLYTCLGDTGEKFQSYLSKKGVGEVFFVNGGHSIDPNGDGIVDEEKLKALLLKYLNPKESTVIVLNWEGEYYKCLNTCDPNSDEFKRIVKEYIRGYRITKSVMPNALIGYYGFPFRSYWGRDDAWRKTNQNIVPLLKELDVFFPSLYDFYEDTLAFNLNGKEDLKYIEDNTIEAIKMGQQIGKPVMPFIWHRRHHSHKTQGKHLIPAQEFNRHVAKIVATKYLGKKIDGLVWWSSEGYFYRVGDAEYKDKSIDYLDYQYQVGAKYLRLITDAMKTPED